MQQAIEERVDNLEDRTETIETALGRLIANINAYIKRSEKETREFKDEMREFKDEMREFNSKVEADWNRRDEEMEKFREEMKAERGDLNKRWGDLSNKMGTLVEDIVLPNLPRILKDYFGLSSDDVDIVAPRVKKRHSSDRSKRREFDAIGITDRFVFVNETKSKPTSENIERFVASLDEIPDYFPEAKDVPIVPIFSALYLEKDLVALLTRCGVYAMEMKDDNMDLVNYDAVNSRR